MVFEAKRDRDVAADAVAMLDDMDVDQGGLGCYTISVSEAQFSQPRRAPKPKEEAPRSQRELAAAAAKAWGKELPPTDVVQAGDYSAPADCPKALVSNVFDATKTTERDASIETEFGRECQRFGRVLDAECLVRGPDAGALLISFTAVDAARKCCVAMHGRTFDGRGLRCELWPTGARPARRDRRRRPPSPRAPRPVAVARARVEVVSAPPRPSSRGPVGRRVLRPGARLHRPRRAAPPRRRRRRRTRRRRRRAAGAGAGTRPPRRRRAAGGAPPRQRRGFSATPPAAPASRGRGVDNRPAWMTSGGAAPAPAPPPPRPPRPRARRRQPPRVDDEARSARGAAAAHGRAAEAASSRRPRRRRRACAGRPAQTRGGL